MIEAPEMRSSAPEVPDLPGPNVGTWRCDVSDAKLGFLKTFRTQLPHTLTGEFKVKLTYGKKEILLEGTHPQSKLQNAIALVTKEIELEEIKVAGRSVLWLLGSSIFPSPDT